MNIVDYIENVKKIQMILAKNIGVKVKELNVTPFKTVAVYVDSVILKNKCDSGEIPYKYDFIMANKYDIWVKHYFFDIYLEEKKKSNKKNYAALSTKFGDVFYAPVLLFCSIENMSLVIRDKMFDDEINYFDPNDNSGIESSFIKENNGTPYIRFTESLKYKISSKHLKHTFEIFRIKEKNHISLISRFHLPCVRSYYNGKNCYLLPSAITSYKTFINIDFKYFVGSSDPLVLSIIS